MKSSDAGPSAPGSGIDWLVSLAGPVATGPPCLAAHPMAPATRTAAPETFSDRMRARYRPFPNRCLTESPLPAIDLLFVDEHVVVANKPSGLLVHRGWDNDDDVAL